MGLDEIVSVKTLLKKPWILFFIGVFFSSVAITFSLLMFRNFASLVMVIFTVIPLIPIFVKLIHSQEKTFTKTKHLEIKKLILIQFIFLFLGLVISYTIWYVAVPPEKAENLFSQQIISLNDLTGPFGFMTYTQNLEIGKSSCSRLGISLDPSYDLIFDDCLLADYSKSGKPEIVLAKDDVPMYVIAENGRIYNFKGFLIRHIFMNNFWVLVFIYVTSFAFGAGALFIITWNASIVGAFLGQTLRERVLETSGGFFSYLIEFPKIVAPLLTHGIFEFLGFFGAAISGGVLSVAFLKHSLKSDDFATILRESSELLLLSVLLILIGAIIESYF